MKLCRYQRCTLQSIKYEISSSSVSPCAKLNCTFDITTRTQLPGRDNPPMLVIPSRTVYPSPYGHNITEGAYKRRYRLSYSLFYFWIFFHVMVLSDNETFHGNIKLRQKTCKIYWCNRPFLDLTCEVITRFEIWSVGVAVIRSENIVQPNGEFLFIRLFTDLCLTMAYNYVISFLEHVFNTLYNIS